MSQSFSDQEVIDALAAQIPQNPTGASAIDVLVGLGYYGQVQSALVRLVEAGKLRETSPGNYLLAAATPAAQRQTAGS